MIWHVFKIDDPETYPDMNCPMIVCQSPDDWPEIYQWDNIEHVFINDYQTKKLNRCFYSYVGYLPYIERELHPVVCGCSSDFTCPYGSDDNGYCLFDDDFKCGFMKPKTEYSIGYKRIWREWE